MNSPTGLSENEGFSQDMRLWILKPEESQENQGGLVTLFPESGGVRGDMVKFPRVSRDPLFTVPLRSGWTFLEGTFSGFRPGLFRYNIYPANNLQDKRLMPWRQRRTSHQEDDPLRTLTVSCSAEASHIWSQLRPLPRLSNLSSHETVSSRWGSVSSSESGKRIRTQWPMSGP